MKSLQTIQKTFHIFGIFTKIAFVFSIVGAVLCAVAALSVAAGYTGGQMFSLFGKPVILFTTEVKMNQTMAVILSDLVILTTEAILLGFATRYFKTEQEEGTPFTENGAQLLKRLGIRCIYMPIVASVLVSVITACFSVEGSGDLSDLPGVATGIVLILASLIFRYGAELEQKARVQISDGEQ